MVKIDQKTIRIGEKSQKTNLKIYLEQSSTKEQWGKEGLFNMMIRKQLDIHVERIKLSQNHNFTIPPNYL